MNKTIEINGILLRLDNIEAIGDFYFYKGETARLSHFDLLYQSNGHRGILRIEFKAYPKEKSTIVHTGIILLRELIKDAIDQKENLDWNPFQGDLNKMINDEEVIFSIRSVSSGQGSKLEFLL